ncbi:MAG: DUF6477 family protein [Rhodobacteraceae bacterium]|nr:DUF6477 family protein [Paracoccaceae bacterium]
MTIKPTLLAGLRRPGILIESARIGVKHYQREKALNRLFKTNRPNAKTALVSALKAREQDIENLRQLGDGTYRAQHHVQVMTALIAEARR